MEKIEVFIRPIIKHLKKIKGDDLYISGQCLLSPLRFCQYFIEKNPSGYRPIFSLKPDKSNDKLILIMDGPIENFGNGKFLSQDKKTVCFHNTHPLMYIFRKDDFDEKDQRIILKGFDFRDIIYNQGLIKENKICERILDIGFIQSSVVQVLFTATFDHELSKAGRFTLVI